MNQPRHILLLAFAYEPGRGSEPGVGWNIAHALAERYKVTVVTRPETYIPDSSPVDVVRVGVPGWPNSWDPTRIRPVLQLYYYAWTRALANSLPGIIEEAQPDLIQHLTFVRYWMPSAAETLGRPFVWGPVGGGEDMPSGFVQSLPLRTRISEGFRTLVRGLVERDPAVRRTADSATIGLAATRETAERMRALTSAPVSVCPIVGISQEEIDLLQAIPSSESDTLRLISIGRLIDWKGYDLALDAMKGLKGVHYTIVGDGPRREALKAQADECGLGDSITFTGWVDREEVLRRLGDADILVHPSFHDSGGMVCLEAMAAGRPVIALERNGPVLLAGEAGIPVAAPNRQAAVRGLRRAIESLLHDPELRRSLAEKAVARVRDTFLWEKRADALVEFYEQAMNLHNGGPVCPADQRPARARLSSDAKHRSGVTRT